MATEKALTKMTECICPKCGCKHKLRLFWTGDLPAKKHCKKCKKEIKELSNDPLLNNHKLRGATEIYMV